MNTVIRFWDWYLNTLNRKPILITFVSGVLAYGVALVCSLIAIIFTHDGWIYSFSCLFGASLVLGYHWVMSRFQISNSFSQFLHLSGALVFMWMALAMPIRFSLLMD